jgi:ABC-type phosphate transport system permease subunit
MDLGEDLISLVCLVLNAIALVRCRKLENLDAIECGVVGVFIAPTTKSGRWEAVCRMAHRTLSGAPATLAGRWVLTVGALTGGASGLSSGAPDRSCRLSGAPSARALTLACTIAHLMWLQSTVGAK